MSTQRPAAFVTPDPDDPDPYDIVPDDFVDRFEGAETIPEALAAAARQPSTTDARDKRRCPECLQCKVRRRRDFTNQTDIDDDWKCKETECCATFDRPVPPAADVLGDRELPSRKANGSLDLDTLAAIYYLEGIETGRLPEVPDVPVATL